MSDPLPEIDERRLNRELDRCKAKVFMGNNAAFLGPLMCGMDFFWTRRIPTAATDGAAIYWNPDWFDKLLPETRPTVLVHELWHPAALHMVRIGDRDPKIWNYAGDIWINNGLELEGYSFKGVENCWKDQSYGKLNTEAIYDDLIKNQKQPQCAPWGSGGPDDLDIEITPQAQQKAINNVIQAAHSAVMSGNPGHVPGHIQEIIKNFLKPKVKWEVELLAFMTELQESFYSWRRPRRRMLGQGLYLPTHVEDKGRLQHIAWYFDISGSMGNKEIRRIISEAAYVWQQFKPKRMTLITFDQVIHDIFEFVEGDTFDEIKITGRGGTSFAPVREHIMETKPNAAIICSDMDTAPMRAGPTCPILWVALRSKRQVNVGKVIRINP